MTLLLETARPLEEDDVEALRAAAGPLLQLLGKRRLTGSGSQKDDNRRHHCGRYDRINARRRHQALGPVILLRQSLDSYDIASMSNLMAEAVAIAWRDRWSTPPAAKRTTPQCRCRMLGRNQPQVDVLVRRFYRSNPEAKRVVG